MRFNSNAVLFSLFGSFVYGHLKGHDGVVYDKNIAIIGEGVNGSRSGEANPKVSKDKVSICVALTCNSSVDKYVITACANT